MNERIQGRKNYPTEEVDANNFLSDQEIRDLVAKKEDIEFTHDDYIKLFNCVHCGECETEAERIALKEKFIQDGNTFDEYNEMIDNFKQFRSPYPTNKMRIRKPEGIPDTSDTLFFMGCLSTIRIPRYTEHALQFLLKQNIDFTIFDKEICCGWHLKISGLKDEYEVCMKENIEIFKSKGFKKILCLCPACYYLFKEEYTDLDLEISYIADYLKPASEKKKGSVAVQHLCQLMNRGRTGVDTFVDNILSKSGYEVVDVPHWCCGGGQGYLHRTDVIEAIARKRMDDFDREDVDFATTYCPSCWWILRRYSKLFKINPKAKDLFELIK